jgi:hypothetical protein
MEGLEVEEDACAEAEIVLMIVVAVLGRERSGEITKRGWIGTNVVPNLKRGLREPCLDPESSA